ncbi:hypothetical protein [Streptomyces sp. HNM0574]|uniref:hypothetical protein n=1 Tax=Streptomyces sp. HNM0574 TaxID=2714954 RepID=UPI00146C3F83|nr:hypothetical protein [Streptomyces sp. HNM0574]NLU68295.1 hypothetical protein [Streptomyces sp. HNM0574]
MAATRLSGRRGAGEKGSWELREHLRARIGELEALLLARTQDSQATGRTRILAEKATAELAEAREVLRHEHRRRLSPTHLMVAQTHFEAAHALLLRLLPLEDVKALLPGLMAFVREHLPPTDERRVRLEEIDRSVRPDGAMTAEQRENLVDAVITARQAQLKEHLRVRSFARIVYGVAGVLTVVAVLVGLFGGISPGAVPLCFRPDSQLVCPTGSSVQWRDYLIVEFAGLVAAAVAAAASLRKIRGTATPYNIPVALALLKLPTGALTAVLGLLLMRGSFVPGLMALDSSAQIIAWAIVFGYAQQIFTKLVDSQAKSVLSSVGGPGRPPPGKSARNEENGPERP